jgi:multidrug efflux pump subunit AcrA (membrane-fusion protein)
MSAPTAQLAQPGLPALQLARTPRYVRRFAWLVLVLLVVAVPVLAVAPWTQTAHGSGRAVAFNPVQRPQFVISPIEARIKKWHVVEGDRVRAGQLLVELVDNDPQILERLREQLLLAEQRLALAEGRVIDQDNRIRFVASERVAQLAADDARIAQAEEQILVVEFQKLQAEDNSKREDLAYKRTLELFESSEGRLATKDAVEEAQRKAGVAAKQVSLVDKQYKQALRALDVANRQKDATDKRTNALLATEEASLKSARAERASVKQQENQFRIQVERQQNQNVYAATDGTVFRVLANADAGGALVRPGERLAMLVPAINSQGDVNTVNPALVALAGGPMGVSSSPEAMRAKPLTDEKLPGIVAELNIDGIDLPLVRTGDRVLLQFEGWAAVQFAAYPEAAVGTFEGRVYLVDSAADPQTGRFRILVEPAPGVTWPDESILRQGVRAQGWVILNEVTVGYEMWRLLNGFPPAREVKTKEPGRSIGPVGK